MSFFSSNNCPRQRRDVRAYGDGCGYAGRRAYSDGCGIRGRAYDVAPDVRRRVGIPIPNVKLPYYPLYVLGGCTEALAINLFMNEKNALR